MLSCLLTATFCLGLWGPVVALIYMVLLGFPALAATMGLFRGFRIESILGLVLAVFAIGSALLLVSSGVGFSALRDTLSTSLEESFSQILALYREVGVAESQVHALDAHRSEVVSGIVEMIPAISLILVGLVWLANLWISGRWVAWPQLENLSCWQIPPAAIWILIASGFLMFTPLAGPARNVFAVMLAAYFFQGAAIVSYYLLRFRVPRPLRGAVLVLSVLEQILGMFVLLLGIFDLWGDFRRLGSHSGDPLAEAE